MPTVREVTIDLLRELGMTTIFGNPGSTELPFLRDLPDDFRYVLALQEASALSMAEGYARGTGNAALVNLHTAPGLGNAMGALVTAYHNKTPLVVTAGQQHRGHLALEPLLSGRLVELARPYVKRSHEPGSAGDVPHELLRAYHTARQQPSGPVFLSIPMDDWEAEAVPPEVREVSYRTAPDPEALRRAAGVLRAARRPAIVAGPGVARSGAFPGVAALAERLRAEVWQDGVAALAGFPQSHPLFRGVLPLAQRLVAETLAPYDAVLVLGAPAFTYYPYLPGPVVREGTALVQITEDPEEAARAPAGTGIVGDVGLAAGGLLELLPEPERPAPPAPKPPPAPEPSSPMSVDYVMHTLAGLLPEGAVIADESTSSKPVLYRRLRADDPLGHLTSAAGGLGFAMPAAVGLGLALPGRKVVCVIGDGSSMYSIQSLWTAARYGVGVAVVVINNRGYSILKSFRDLMGLGPNIPGLELPGIDMVQIARGFGCRGERVEEPEDLPAALKRALSSGEPYVVDALVDTAVPRMAG
ncbi:thiamine pyrophosphate enzyme-like TPP-binding protein [Rubrobacter xylanophilus DSM 9941]|uniref:Thiamine pyrophosphate enzyme-like TPP-binding protein n=2 Tax=Rubrobacter xylanophilus TaxID=49319 RepID=Q1AXG7_RUBXD|nr:thiamine pyrophosphate enzyme-like TPP-binding protein [Rubrobacter xylanophilus DSM 9941]